MPTIIMCEPISVALSSAALRLSRICCSSSENTSPVEQPRRDVDLDVELAELGHERVVGDPLEHLGVCHRRVAGLVGQVELDLEPDRALLGVEARLAQHPREDVQVALDLVAVPLTVFTAEDLDPNVFAHRAHGTSRRAHVGDGRQRRDRSRVVLLTQADVRLLAHRARRDADRLDRRGGVEHRHDEQRLDRDRPRPARVLARLGLLERLDDREHAPPDRGVEHEPVARRDPRPAREAGAPQQLRPLVEPALAQRPARVPDGLEPVPARGVHLKRRRRARSARRRRARSPSPRRGPRAGRGGRAPRRGRGTPA